MTSSAPAEPTAMLGGATVYRVVWLPGSDLLCGYCWCGVAHEAEDPVGLWEWLLDHPDTHEDDGQRRAQHPR